MTDPSSQTQQSAVASSATTLGGGGRSARHTPRSARPAQNDLGGAIAALNSTLATIGQLNNQIVALQPTNQGTADLQNQRNAAVQTLSQLLDIEP